MNKYNVFNLRTTFEDNFYVLEDNYGDEITLTLLQSFLLRPTESKVQKLERAYACIYDIVIGKPMYTK